MITNIQPIVYTRPYKRFILDYCYFAYPHFLSAEDQKFIDSRIRNVLAVEGYRGEIQCRRWHILRIRDYVLIGIATEEFGRIDDSSTPIRGYYGLFMSVKHAMIPTNISLYKKLDQFFVEPHYNDDEHFSPNVIDNLSDEAFFDSSNYFPPSDNNSVVFNTDPSKVKFFSSADIHSELDFLSHALFYAINNPSFEFVFGMNKRKHAFELPIMNVVCYEQTIEKIELFSQDRGTRSSSLGFQRNPQSFSENRKSETSTLQRKKMISPKAEATVIKVCIQSEQQGIIEKIISFIRRACRCIGDKNFSIDIESRSTQIATDFHKRLREREQSESHEDLRTFGMKKK